MLVFLYSRPLNGCGSIIVQMCVACKIIEKEHTECFNKINRLFALLCEYGVLLLCFSVYRFSVYAQGRIWNNKTATTAPIIGPNNGTIAYPQLESPLPLMGRSA